MPVSEKQKSYARKWDKDNMRTLGTRVRTEEAEDFKAWCAMNNISCTAAIKNFIMAELEKYYKVLDGEHERESNNK